MARNRYKARYTKPSKKIPLTSLIAYLLVAVTLTLGATFSRFSTSGQSNDTARVASFVLMGSDGSTNAQLPLENIAPGKTVEYTFTVSNYQGESVCEVAQSYTIDFSDFDNLPLEYALQDQAEAYTLPANEAKTNSHVLKITWPAAENQAAYADEIDLVTITVTSSQID